MMKECQRHKAQATHSVFILPKGGFPVIVETTRNHTFSKEVSQVILAAMVLAPNFYCKSCQRVIPAMRGNPPLACKQTYGENEERRAYVHRLILP